MHDFLESTFLDVFYAPFLTLNDLITKSKQKKPISVNWITGACLVLRRELLEDIGIFDEHFFLYYEEVDLCYERIKTDGKYFLCLTAMSFITEDKVLKKFNIFINRIF